MHIQYIHIEYTYNIGRIAVYTTSPYIHILFPYFKPIIHILYICLIQAPNISTCLT